MDELHIDFRIVRQAWAEPPDPLSLPLQVTCLQPRAQDDVHLEALGDPWIWLLLVVRAA